MEPEAVAEFFAQFQDHLAPRLDTYEQAIYLYVFRHSRFIGQLEAVIGFRSARVRLACGIGESGHPMSEHTAYAKLASLHQKGLIEIVRTTHAGKELRLKLPREIPGVIPVIPEQRNEADLESMDFFNDPVGRRMLLEREGHRCFYTLERLDDTNFVVEHVRSRPDGNNSYRNCVASSRQANNMKGSVAAEDFLRRLFRTGYLSEVEFEDRMRTLGLLLAGELKPVRPDQIIEVPSG